MANWYSYVLFVLLITHWTNTASLHSSSNQFIDRQNSSIIYSEYLTLTPTFLRRRVQWPLIKRLRRWIRNQDNDEIEIPIDETLPNQLNSITESVNNIFPLNPIVNSTLLHFETTESSSSIIKDLDNSTISSQLNRTIAEGYSTENEIINSTIINEIKYPLLRQDINEENITSIIKQVLQDNKTDDIDLITINSISSSTVINKFVDINSTDSETIFIKNITDLNLIPVLVDQTTNISAIIPNESDTIITLLNYTTGFYNTTDDNQTNEFDILFNDNTETISINTTINSDISRNDTIIFDKDIDRNTIQNETTISDVTQNDTSINIIEPNENSNDTTDLLPKLLVIPICDQSCQCSKECLWGFEILNDTCLCDPPCKNYPCFGNDTCIITDKGQPSCQPQENVTEHARPIRCYQPRKSGYHDAENVRYHNRWYYNPDQDTCHLFVYRGLGGNKNNFLTLNDCHLECITCAPLPDAGECLAHINMWYYDYKTSECSQFEYSGCKGNENKFLHKEQCIDTCVNRIFNLK